MRLVLDFRLQSLLDLILERGHLLLVVLDRLLQQFAFPHRPLSRSGTRALKVLLAGLHLFERLEIEPACGQPLSAVLLVCAVQARDKSHSAQATIADSPALKPQASGRLSKNGIAATGLRAASDQDSTDRRVLRQRHEATGGSAALAGGFRLK